MADKKFLVNIDLDQNQLKNVTLHPLAAVPVATGEDGQLYYDTGDQLTYQYKAGATNAWEVIGGSGTTNLSEGTHTTVTFEILSSSGSSVEITEANGSEAGVLSAGAWSFIEALRDPSRSNDDPDMFILWKDTALLTGGPSGFAQADWFLDEDNFSSDSNEKVASQQSIKAYVDTEIGLAVSGGVTYKGGYNASTNTPDLDTSPSGIIKGDMYTCTFAGTFFTVELEIGDVLIAEIDNAAVEADWTIVEKNLTGAVTNTTGSTLNHLASFADGTGQVIKDSGVIVIGGGNLDGNNTGDEIQATEALLGIAELATQGETDAGTDDLRIVTPLKLATYSGWDTVARRYELSLPATATTNVPHSLGNRFVTAEVYKSATPYERVEVVIECLDANNLTVKFNTAPALDEYTIVVVG